MTYGSERVSAGHAVRTAHHVDVVAGRQLADLEQQDGGVVNEDQGVDQRQGEHDDGLFPNEFFMNIRRES